MGDSLGIIRLKGDVLIKNVQQAGDFLRPYSAYHREQMIVVHLTPLLNVIAIQVVSIGTMTSVQFEMQDIFRQAIILDSKAIIVAHNHPYEDRVIESMKDVHITEDLVKAGEVLRIPVLDHIVLGRSDFWSFRKNGEGGFEKSEDYRDSLRDFGINFRVRHKISNTLFFECHGKKAKKKRRIRK
jgi:DNA repair protein RadC